MASVGLGPIDSRRTRAVSHAAPARSRPACRAGDVADVDHAGLPLFRSLPGCDGGHGREGTDLRDHPDRPPAPSPSREATFLAGGTVSSNPPSSSRQSVSRGISPFCIEKPAVAAACAGPARRHGRQRRAGLVNITPTARNVSVGRFSSTAVPAGSGSLTVVTSGALSEFGVAMRL